MNEMVKTTHTPTLLEIRMDAERFPRVKSIPEDKAVNSLAKIVLMAFMYSGRQASHEDISFIACNLYRDIMADEFGLGMATLSFAEIERSIKKSVLGQGKEMFGISVASIYNVLADYCKGEGHQVSVQMRQLKQAERIKALKDASVQSLVEANANQMIINRKIK